MVSKIKRLKRSIPTLLVVLCLMAVLFAPMSVSAAEGVTEKNGHVFYDPAITLNIARSVGPDMKFKEGQDINNNAVNDWLLEEFGVKVNYIWTTPTTDNAFYTKLMLSIAAGEELPEFFAIPGAQAHELIDSGLFMPVDEMLDQYAGETWQKVLAEVPNAPLPYVRDGQTYALPCLEYLYEHEDVLWIRQDWLDAVGMEAPTTLEELRAVMQAFTELDSNVTGQSKVYGIAAAMQSNYTSWIGVNPIFGGFGAIPQIWMKNAEGEIVYGSTMLETLDALKEFKTWIEKGYFAPDAVLMNEVGAYELFTAGKAGIAIAPTWCYDWPFKDVEKNVPGAVVKPYPIPDGPTDTFTQVGQGAPYQVMLFSASAKYPQVFFQVQNYLYENYSDPEFGSQFEFGFQEGFDYVKLDDGTISYKDADFAPDVKASVPFFMSPMIPSMKIEIASYLAAGNEPVTPAQIKSSIGWNQNFLDAAQIVNGQKDHTIYNLFEGAPTPTMITKLADLRAAEVETFGKILMGKVDADAGFEQWLDFWNKNGGPEITDEVRQWYEQAGGE